MSGRPRKYDALLQQFSQGEPTAFMQVGEPEVIKSAPPPPEETEAGLMERFAQGTSDAIRGGLRGLTMGYGDKLDAAARSALGGGTYEEEFARQNAMHDAAAARSPYAYNIGKTIGGAPWDLAAAVAGAPGGIPGEMAASGALGALRGAGMSSDPTLHGTLEDANRGGAEGSAWGLGGSVLGRGVSAASDALTGLSPSVRASALGQDGARARALRAERGDDFVENLPVAAEQLGMTPEVPMDWRHPIDSVGKMLTFRSPGDYADEAQGLRQTHGAAKGQAVADATAQGVSVPRDAVVEGLQGQVAAQPNNLNARPYGRAMDQLADGMPGGRSRTGTEGGDDWISDEQLSASQLDQLKMDWAEGGYPPPGAVQRPSDAVRSRAQRDAASVARDQLGNAIDEMALPETATAYRSANDAYSNASSIEGMARGKQLDLDTQNPFSLPNVGRTLGGVSGGAAIGGAVAGLPGAALGAVSGFVGNKAIQNYGADVAADFLRAGRGRDAMIGATAGAAFGGAPGALAGGAIGALGGPGLQAAGRSGAAVGGGRDLSMMDRFSRGDSAEHERSIADGRGYMLADVVQDALQNEPQALGPYANQFAEAMGSRRSGAVSALLSRLSQTDETWRTQYLPALRARTGGDNGF